MKINSTLKAFVLLIIILVTIFATKLISSKSYKEDNINNPKINETNKEIIIESPNDPNSKIILKNSDGGASSSVFLKTQNNNEEYIMEILSPRGIVWSPNSNRVTIVNHIS